MIFDSDGMHHSALGPFDVVIVGAGTVGLVMAQRFSANGLNVAVVEIGSRVATTVGTDGGAESIGHLHYGTTIGRASGLGGTSALWGGQLAEMVKEDLAYPGRSWPIDFSELKFWYDKAYDELALPGRKLDAEYRQVFSINDDIDNRIDHFFTFWLPKPNMASLYKNSLVKERGVSVFLNVTVNSISIRDGRATELRGVSRSGKFLSFSAKNIIFSAGTIGNIRSLLTMGRFCDVPWRENRNIGRYFQDHIGVSAASVDVIDESRFRTWFENGFALGRKLQPKLRHTSEARIDTPLGVSGFFGFRSSVSEELSRVKSLIKSVRSGLAYSRADRILSDVWKIGRSFSPLVWKYLKDRRILAMYDLGVEFLIQSEQIPIERSAVRAKDNSRGRDGLISVLVDWQVDGREIGSIKTFVRDANEFLESRKLARLRVHPWVSDATNLNGLPFEDTRHQCGGLCMGLSASTSVTDRDCRIWGTHNVFVAGASVFPTSGYANCTLTAIALGLRVTDLISREVRRGP